MKVKGGTLEKDMGSGFFSFQGATRLDQTETTYYAQHLLAFLSFNIVEVLYCHKNPDKNPGVLRQQHYLLLHLVFSFRLYFVVLFGMFIYFRDEWTYAFSTV